MKLDVLTRAESQAVDAALPRVRRAAQTWLRARRDYDAALCACHQAKEAADQANEKLQQAQAHLCHTHPREKGAVVVSGRLIIFDHHLVMEFDADEVGVPKRGRKIS